MMANELAGTISSRMEMFRPDPSRPAEATMSCSTTKTAPLLAVAVLSASIAAALAAEPTVESGKAAAETPASPVRGSDSGRDDAQSGDLKRFLPNHGNCVLDAKNLLRQWPPDGPKELWRVEVGWGKSAVVEADGRAFTAAETDDQQWALCLDPATGATKWKHLLLAKKNRHFEWGPTTSPVIDGDRVYFIPYANHENDVWELRCPIVCLKADGTELWRVDKEVWASEASTPLVVGDTLYVGADNPQKAVLVALDKMTGAVRWTAAAKSERPRELAAPASLTYQVVGGVPQVIVATYGTREVLGVHAATGEIMWRYPYPADIILGLVSTPVAVGSRLFLSAGEGKGRNFSACLEMQAAGGKIACRELYRSTELQTNQFHTASIHQDAVFGFGGGNKAGFLHCTNFEDGRLLWKEENRDWTKDQNLVIADGLLFALTRNDELVMAEASRQRYQELGRVALKMKLGRPQHPTIANGRLYIRGEQWVVCYQVGR
jgi:outer membrane protein assembly factor BamB